jgi:hypothetical protein
LPDLARRERGIGELAHAQRHVNAGFDHVDVAIVEHDINGKGRVLCQESRKVRDDVKTRKGYGRADPQTPGQSGAGTARGEPRRWASSEPSHYHR